MLRWDVNDVVNDVLRNVAAILGLNLVLRQAVAPAYSRLSIYRLHASSDSNLAHCSEVSKLMSSLCRSACGKSSKINPQNDKCQRSENRVQRGLSGISLTRYVALE